MSPVQTCAKESFIFDLCQTTFISVPNMTFQPSVDSNDRNFSNPPVRWENSATTSIAQHSTPARWQRQHSLGDNGFILKLPSLLTEADLQRYQPGDALTYGLAYLQRPIALQRHLPDAEEYSAKQQPQASKNFLNSLNNQSNRC